MYIHNHNLKKEKIKLHALNNLDPSKLHPKPTSFLEVYGENCFHDNQPGKHLAQEDSKSGSGIWMSCEAGRKPGNQGGGKEKSRDWAGRKRVAEVVAEGKSLGGSARESFPTAALSSAAVCSH